MKYSGRKFILIMVGVTILIALSLYFTGDEILRQVQTPTPTPSNSFRTPKEEFVLEMQPVMPNGQQGKVALETFKGNKTKVRLEVNTATTSAQPTYIHEGTCSAIGNQKATLVYTLNGFSETIIEESMESLLKTPHAVVIHQSIRQYNTVSSCVDIKRP